MLANLPYREVCASLYPGHLLLYRVTVLRLFIGLLQHVINKTLAPHLSSTRECGAYLLPFQEIHPFGVFVLPTPKISSLPPIHLASSDTPLLAPNRLKDYTAFVYHSIFFHFIWVP